MDKETLSTYGWILVAVLIGSIMLAMATPLGNFIFANIQNATIEGFNQTNLGKGDKEQVIVESKDRKKIVYYGKEVLRNPKRFMRNVYYTERYAI